MSLPAPVAPTDSFEVQRTALNATIGEVDDLIGFLSEFFANFPSDPWYVTLHNPSSPITQSSTVAAIQLGNQSGSGNVISGAWDIFGGGNGFMTVRSVFNGNLTPDERVKEITYSDGTTVLSWKNVFKNPDPSDTEIPVIIDHPGSPVTPNSPALLLATTEFDTTTRVNPPGWAVNYELDNLWISFWNGTTYDQKVQIDKDTQSISFFDGLYVFDDSSLQFIGADNDLVKGKRFETVTANRYSETGTTRINSATGDVLKIPVDSFQAGGRVYLTLSIRRWNGTTYSTNAEVYDMELFVNWKAGAIVAINFLRNNTWVDRTTALDGTGRFQVLAPGAAFSSATAEKIAIWIENTSQNFLSIGSKMTVGGGITPWQTGTPETGGTDIVIFLSYRTEASFLV